MKYVDEIITAIATHEPISPWGLHAHCASWTTAEGPDNLRLALRAVIQAGWVKMTDGGVLVTTSEMPAGLSSGDPVSSPGEGDLETSTSHPTQSQEPPPPLRLVPTVPPTSDSHSDGQTGSRTHALRCAIQSGVESLSHLEDALRTFLQDAHHLGDGKVRRAASDLFHKVATARRESEESDRWLQESPHEHTEG